MNLFSPWYSWKLLSWYIDWSSPSVSCIGGVMVLALSEITGSSPGQVKPKIMKLVFVASQLSTQREQERAKTGWLGIRIMHPRRVTYLRMDTCFQWATTINQTKHVGLVQNRYHYHLIICKLFLPLYSWRIAPLALNNNRSLILCNKLIFYLLKELVHIWYDMSIYT
jgi:hypothetical protein